jgi:sodium-dependent dicarboxylate transporter 2/3/5
MLNHSSNGLLLIKHKKKYMFAAISMVLIVLFFLFTSPIEGLNIASWRMLGLIIIMVGLWILDLFPLAVVGLIPLVYAPLMGVADIKAILPYYSESVIFLTLGGLALGVAMETSGLHKRIALFTLSKVGSSLSIQLFAFMGTTALLSMWINNTSTVVMLLPVAISVINALSITTKDNNFAKALLLGMAYAASIGGIGTLIGTSTNFVMVGILESQANIKIDFLDWMKIGVPLMLILLVVAYFLIIYLFKINKMKIDSAFNFKAEYDKLGLITNTEKLVIAIFFITAFLWMFKALINDIFAIKLSDEITSVFAFTLLFTVPTSLKEKRFVLNMDDFKKIQFHILLLLGGGMALAGLSSKTGLDLYVSTKLAFLSAIPVYLMILGIVTLIIFTTELTSNNAIVASFLPLFIVFAKSFGINPLLLALPLTLSASLAFMLPVATPPNAVIFSSGQIKITDMVKTGVWLNLICIAIVSIYSYYVIPYIFNL